MCGRTGLSIDKDQVRCACSYKSKENDLFTKPEWLYEHNDGKEFVPSYNIAPSEVSPVMISASNFKNAVKSDKVLKPMMWGIIPPWHEGDYRTHNLSTNNCKLETIKSSNLYGPILRNGGRCIVVAEGFYEWQTTDKSSKIKQPYFIYAPQTEGVKIDEPQTWNNSFSEERGWQGIHLLHMAGLYHVWHDNDTIIYSYTVITMESNDTFSWLHHRMPAILDTQEQIDAWLNIDEVDTDSALSHLTPAKTVSWHQVSTEVNNSRNKSEQCNKRLVQKKTKLLQKNLNDWCSK